MEDGLEGDFKLGEDDAGFADEGGVLVEEGGSDLAVGSGGDDDAVFAGGGDGDEGYSG
jgi:hypothetical protein